MEQLLVHILGDYALQSDWMASNKSKKSFPCLIHVLIYTACFLIITTSWKALLVIGLTHFIIDRWNIILKRLIWLKNHFPTGKYPPFEFCDTSGYYDDSQYNTNKNIYNYIEYSNPRNHEITWWLYIIHDNFLHLLINFLALKYL